MRAYRYSQGVAVYPLSTHQLTRVPTHVLTSPPSPLSSSPTTTALAILTMAILTMAILTTAILTMAILTKAIELDLDPDGAAVRARLGARTTRTSVPSIWIGGEFVGGLNDGPGLLTLDADGDLEPKLRAVGALA